MTVSPLTTAELAARWHCDATTVAAWCRSGELRASLVGRRWLITEADAARFFDRCSNRPSPAVLPTRGRRAS